MNVIFPHNNQVELGFNYERLLNAKKRKRVWIKLCLSVSLFFLDSLRHPLESKAEEEEEERKKTSNMRKDRDR